MKSDIAIFVAGLATAECIYLFRNVITSWLKAKDATLTAALAKATTPAAPPAAPAPVTPPPAA